MTNFEKVGIFMKTFGQEVKTKAELSNNKINELRISLINNYPKIPKNPKYRKTITGKYPFTKNTEK